MGNRFSRVAVFLVTLLAALPWAGCSGGPATVIEGPTTITFWHSQKGPGAALLANLAEEFSRLEPYITVDLAYRGDPSQVAADLSSAVIAGRGPVLAEVLTEALDGLRVAGTIIPMGSFIASRQYGLNMEDLKDFWPCFVQANTVDRQVWGLPFSHKIYGLMYNPDVLQEPPTTWDGLREAASALTRRDANPALSVFGLAFRPDAELFTLFLYQNGGQLLAGDPPRMSFASPQGTGCLEFLAEITTLRRTALLTMGDSFEAVADGRAAMAIGPVGRTADELSGAGVALAPLPSGVARATLAPGTSLVLAAGSDAASEEAGWRFARWLTGTEIAARWAAATGDVPVRRSAMERPVWRQGPGSIRGWSAVIAQMDVAVILPASPSLGRIRDELNAAIPSYLLGRINSSQALLDDLTEKVSRAENGP